MQVPVGMVPPEPNTWRIMKRTLALLLATLALGAAHAVSVPWEWQTVVTDATGCTSKGGINLVENTSVSVAAAVTFGDTIGSGALLCVGGQTHTTSFEFVVNEKGNYVLKYTNNAGGDNNKRDFAGADGAGAVGAWGGGGRAPPPRRLKARRHKKAPAERSGLFCACGGVRRRGWRRRRPRGSAPRRRGWAGRAVRPGEGRRRGRRPRG